MSAGNGASDVVIVGGGLAAQRCAEALRARGYGGPIRMICAEREHPYDRPPLSKAVPVSGDDEVEVRFRDADWYRDNGVELLLGRRASGLDPGARRVDLSDGGRLRYGELVIATGATPRALPLLARYANAFPLRTLADARRLRAELTAGARLAIVGAGFIGQEVAATARALGVEVTILEALELPLTGILGPEFGRWVVATHRAEGVRVLTGARLESARGNGRVEELHLAGGDVIGCDAVLVAIGIEPATTWLAGSGLDPGGVRTDATGRTAVPHVYAAGDVARPFDPRHGGHVRSEHWDSASRQGVAVAAAILGEEPRAPALPTFWSDQYGVRIQYVGHAAGADEIEASGELRDRDFHLLYRRAGRPVAALAVDRPRELVALRRLIEGAAPASGSPADPSQATTKEMIR